MLLNNHTSKYNSFILVLYRRYKNHVSVYPPTPLFGTLLRHCLYIYVGIKLHVFLITCWEISLCPPPPPSLSRHATVFKTSKLTHSLFSMYCSSAVFRISLELSYNHTTKCDQHYYSLLHLMLPAQRIVA